MISASVSQRVSQYTSSADVRLDSIQIQSVTEIPEIIDALQGILDSNHRSSRGLSSFNFSVISNVAELVEHPENHVQVPGDRELLRNIVCARIRGVVCRLQAMEWFSLNVEPQDPPPSRMTLVVHYEEEGVRGVRNNPDVRMEVLAAVRRDGVVLQRLEARFKRDPEIVLEAIRNNVKAFQYADLSLHEKEWFVLEVMKTNGLALQFLQGSLRFQKNVIEEALQSNGMAYAFIPKEWRARPFLMVQAVQSDRRAATLFSDAELEQRKVIESIVRDHLGVIEFLPTNLFSDYAIGLAIVEQDGMLLERLDPSLRADYHIVATAVRSDGRAIQFASEALKNNERIGVAALRQTAEAFSLVGDELRGNKKFIKFFETNIQGRESLDIVDEAAGAFL